MHYICISSKRLSKKMYYFSLRDLNEEEYTEKITQIRVEINIYPDSWWALPVLITDELTKNFPYPTISNIRLTTPTLSTIIFYINRIQKIDISCKAPHKFCWHKHSFTFIREIMNFFHIRKLKQKIIFNT